MPNEAEPQRPFPATDKERFDLCIAMLKGYYDALEGRVATSVGLFVVVAGWLITSQTARDAIAKSGSVFALTLVTLTLLVGLYAANIARWVIRWREIRRYTDNLHYAEPEYYARYKLHNWTWAAYFTPVALVYACMVVALLLVRTGQFN